jgi:5-histidylcysteine sulfoxide synthase/putative 4-mercaptohistidine N1-methyltranferase
LNDGDKFASRPNLQIYNLNMQVLNDIHLTLDGQNINQKRKDIKQYFINTYTQFEKIFELLKDDDVFYQQSEITRHPMIFYFGHTATFFINKLVLAKVITQRLNPSFESIFAIGVDEMTWDDMESSNYDWPKVSEVRQYRKSVKNLIIELIDTIDLSLPIKKDSAMWIILMGIEHEKIHIETSLVLHRQMPIELIKYSDEFQICNTFTKNIKNEMITIPSANIHLGKDESHNLYGWDNEYGKDEFYVQEFQTSKYLVSNEEFMEFVNNNAYNNLEYWDKEGQEFLKNTKAQHPSFWIKDGNTYRYRTINQIIDMPLSWPVDINALEAKAFCRYKSMKENINYSLMSEAQYKALYKFANVTKESKANHNLELYSSVPVNTYNFNGVYDVIGNAWQWSETCIYPYEGFEVHEMYDDFSVPTFDNKHALINGSSWASTGNLIDSYSRYAFRRHFYQNASFRYIINNNKEEDKMTNENIYETDNLVSQYCDFQYGDTYFGVDNFSLACANIAKKYINNTNKALDIGCATGRLSFELTKYFNKVDGIDFSARFIQVGTALKEDSTLKYKSFSEGESYDTKSINIKDLGYESTKSKVEFYQGDACNLKAQFNAYDMIIGTNLIDRLYDPRLFLNDIEHRLNKDGILILTSPYTWLEEYTKKENWIGGYTNKEGKEISTLEGLKAILNNSFELIHTQDVPFVIKETKRKYQHTIAELSVWKKL